MGTPDRVDCPTGQHLRHDPTSGIYAQCRAAAARQPRYDFSAPSSAPSVVPVAATEAVDTEITSDHYAEAESLGAQHGLSAARALVLTDASARTMVRWDAESDTASMAAYAGSPLSGDRGDQMSINDLTQELGLSDASPSHDELEYLTASYEEAYVGQFLPELVRRAKALDRAIETAREHLPIQRKIVREEFWEPQAIVDEGGRLGVYKASAWTRPTETPLLPWSAPKGTVVGYVNLDGSYSPAEQQ